MTNDLRNVSLYSLLSLIDELHPELNNTRHNIAVPIINGFLRPYFYVNYAPVE